MALTLSGRLYDPYGNALPNAGIRFKAVSTSTQILRSVDQEAETDSSGDYSIGVRYGVYDISVRQSQSDPWYKIASDIPVTTDSTSNDLNALIVAYQGDIDATPEIVLEIEAIAATATAAASSAAASAQAASDAVTVVTTDASGLPVKASGSDAARTLGERFAKELNLKDFGAIGDGGKHPLSDYYASLAEAQADFPLATGLNQSRDSAAFDAMMDVARTYRSVYVDDSQATVQNLAYRLSITADQGAYYLNTPVNMTGMNAAHSWWYVDFRGCTFFTNTGAGKCSFDLFDSRKCHWLGGTVISANQTDVQRIGVQIGRNSTGRPADSNHFDGLEVKGYFTLAPFYNYCSEDCLFLQVMAKNNYNSTESTCWVQDADNYYDVQSDYQDTATTGTLASFLNNHFLRCDFRNTSTGTVLNIVSGAVGHVYESIYLAVTTGAATKVIFNTSPQLRGMKLVGHHESDYADGDPSNGIQYGIQFVDNIGSREITVHDFQFGDVYCHAQASVIRADATVDSVTMRNCDLEMGRAERSNPSLLFSPASKFDFTGTIKWSGPYNGYTLAGLSQVSADLYVDDALSVLIPSSDQYNVRVIGSDGAYDAGSSSGSVGTGGYFSQKVSDSSGVRGSIRWNNNYSTDGRWESLIGGAISNYTTSTSFSPGVDSGRTLGIPSGRWTQLYAASGTINTSDEREKTPIEGLSDSERLVAAKVKALLGKYKWLDSVGEKGDAARWHFGAGAQSVKEAFESEGLDGFDYGCLCYDEWGDDEDAGVEAGSRYGIRPDELLFFMMAAL